MAVLEYPRDLSEGPFDEVEVNPNRFVRIVSVVFAKTRFQPVVYAFSDAPFQRCDKHIRDNKSGWYVPTYALLADSLGSAMHPCANASMLVCSHLPASSFPNAPSPGPLASLPFDFVSPARRDLGLAVGL
jgi:hypothetical protein